MKRKIFLALLTGSVSLWASESGLFEVPELKPLSSRKGTWALLRPPYLVVNEEVYDLRSKIWPEWDFQSNPPRLNPVASLSTSLLIRSSSGTEKVMDLKQGLSILDFLTEFETQQSLDVLAKVTLGERVHWISPVKKISKPKVLLRCHLNSEFYESWADQDSSARSCASLIRGLPEASWIFWVRKPRDLRLGREWRLFEKQSIGKVSSKKWIQVSDSNSDDQKISLDIIKVDPNSWVSFADDWTQFSKEESILLGSLDKSQKISFTSISGARVEISRLEQDTIFQTSWKKNLDEGRSLNLQFVPAADGVQARYRQTEVHEYRTGLRGFFRDYWLNGLVGFQTLSSGRGESSRSFAFPALDIRKREIFGVIEPRIRIQKDLLHMGSDLSVFDFESTFAYSNQNLGLLKPYLGFKTYSLGGRNPGSTRLGSYSSLPIGLQSDIPFRPFILSVNAALLPSLGGQGMSWGYDSRLNLNYLLDPRASDGLVVGAYLGLSSYAVTLNNLVSVPETFSEDFFRVGLSVGWLGQGFF